MKKIIGLIWSIVKRFNNRGYDLEDLYQIACIGFIKSIKKFDMNYEVKLSTYTVPYMIGEIKKFIRDDGLVKVSRSIKELSVKIKELQKEYFYKKGKEIGIDQIAKELKISKEDVALAMESGSQVTSIENATYTNNKDGNCINIIETLKNEKNQEEMITNKLAVKQLLGSLKNREKEVILLFSSKSTNKISFDFKEL